MLLLRGKIQFVDKILRSSLVYSKAKKEKILPLNMKRSKGLEQCVNCNHDMVIFCTLIQMARE